VWPYALLEFLDIIHWKLCETVDILSYFWDIILMSLSRFFFVWEESGDLLDEHQCLALFFTFDIREKRANMHYTVAAYVNYFLHSEVEKFWPHKVLTPNDLYGLGLKCLSSNSIQESAAETSNMSLG
ncbi:hypothetical protein ACJX0J_006820, partial [Zea mays]